MNKVVFIIPYFGKVPDYYPVWEMTARNNSGFDFLIVTDIADIKPKDNIKVKYLKFDNLKKLVQNCFDFSINLEKPYKLCDYKPAYGYIFYKWIEKYEFWGHCDIDIIMGNLSDFITTDVLSSFDKIYEHGHMTLYRNTKKNNMNFMNDGIYPEFNYKEVYQSSEAFYFDEYYGMMLKSRRLDTKTYLHPNDFFDVDQKTFEFYDAVGAKRRATSFIYENGQLYCSDLNQNRVELAYVHFQKRKINYTKILYDMQTSGETRFMIIPNKSLALNVEKSIKEPSYIKKYCWKIRVRILHIIDFFHRYKEADGKYKGIKDYYNSRKNIKARKKQALRIINSQK